MTDRLAPILALVAEGAWISVPAAFLQAATHEPAWLGPGGYTLLAGLGWMVARRSSPAGWRLPIGAPLLVAGGAILGWLGSGEVLRLLLAGDAGAAVVHHPGGWLGGLAALRGIAHARSSSSEAALGGLVALATPGLAIPLLLGGGIPGAGRQAFLDQATMGVVVFLLSGTLGLAVTRMSSVAAGSGFDWRRNRAWLLLLSMLVGAVTLVAVPSSEVVARAIQVLVGVLLVPALILGTIASIPRVTRRTLVSLAVFVAVGYALLVVVQPGTLRPITTGVPGAAGDQPVDNAGVYLAMAVLILAALAVVIVLLVRLWTREAVSSREADVPEERMIDRGETSGRPSVHFRRPTWHVGRASEPTSAPAAYVALIRDLASVTELRRESAETPMAHARRLRSAGTADVRLELLAADYELHRWGDRRLSLAEDRRGIERWRSLRVDLPRARARIEGARRASDAAAEPIDDALSGRRGDRC